MNYPGNIKFKFVAFVLLMVFFISFFAGANANISSYEQSVSQSDTIKDLSTSFIKQDEVLEKNECQQPVIEKKSCIEEQSGCCETCSPCESSCEKKECQNSSKQDRSCIKRDCSKPTFDKKDPCANDCEDSIPCDSPCKNKICPPPIKEEPCCVPKNECKTPEIQPCPGECGKVHPFLSPAENNPCPSFDLKDPCCEPKVECPPREDGCLQERVSSCKSYAERMSCPEEKVIVIDPKIKAIVFGKTTDFFENNNFENATGIVLNDADIPENRDVFSSELDRLFIGKPVTDEKILQIKKHVKQYFYENNHPDVVIKISDQYIRDDVIRVVIEDKVKPEAASCPKCESPCDPNCDIEPLCEADYNLYLKDCDALDLVTPKFKSIILGENESFLQAGKFEKAEGVVLVGVDFPFDAAIFSKRIERGFIGRPITETKIEELKNFIKKYFDEYAHPNLSITFLLQDIKDGIVKILVHDCTPDYCSTEYQRTNTPCIKAIVLICDEDILKKQSFNDARGIIISGPNVPGNRHSFINRLEALFINKDLSKDTILNIKHEIILFYKNNHRPIIAVNVPKQNVTKGVLRLVITEAVLSDLKVVGNKYFSDEQYTKYISLKTCCPIYEKDLVRDVNFLNRNPFRNVDVIYKPGAYPGTTDVDLSVREIRPVRAFYGADNTGLDLIGRERYMAGIHLGNLFWQSHILSYQLTKSFRAHAFEAHTLQYTIPLPWKHLIFVYGGYSRVHAQIPIFVTAKSKGYSTQGSFRYDIPLMPFRHVIHDLNFGFDFKRTNNSVEFRKLRKQQGGNVNLTQLMLSYEATYDKGGLQLATMAAGYCSPGQWLDDQSSKRYKSFRAHSKNHYVYGRGSIRALVHLPRAFSWSLLIDMQYSNRNLLASEVFGIGGYNTVRGYDEHLVNGDNGVVISTELRTASFGVFHYLLSKRLPDHLQFLGFMDYGRVWVNKRELILAKQNYLWSVGPGLRYVIDPFLALRLDWGFTLHRKKIFFAEKQKLHFGVNISF